MVEENIPTLFLVEVIWQGDDWENNNHRSWYNTQDEADAAVIALTYKLTGYGAADAKDACEYLLDDERSSWVDCTAQTTSGVCPKCDAMAGWLGGYCEPCGYQFGDDLNAD
jgi:hypothetical protein